MRYFQYIVTTKHDKGILHLHVAGENKGHAVQIVMNAEGCPRRAIIKIKRLGRKQK